MDTNKTQNNPVAAVPSSDELGDCQAEIQRLRSALEIIESWSLPETGDFWNGDPERPMSYSACYGSNGEREYMRDVARKALAA